MAIVPPKKTTGWQNVVNIVIPFIIFFGSFQWIGSKIAGLEITTHNIVNESTSQLFIMVFFGMFGTFLVVWLFRKYVDKKSFISLGFIKPFMWKDIALGILLGFIIMFSGFAYLALFNHIEILNITFRSVDFILSIAIFIFIAALEELLLRGYVLTNLMSSFNKYIALIISSVIFSLMHAGNSFFNIMAMIDLFLAGMLFGISYIFTKSLWFSIALHFSWNFFQGTIFGFNVSGKDTYSLINTKAAGSNIWSGGDFGFEGSILSILLQLIAIILVFFIYRKRAIADEILINKEPMDITLIPMQTIPGSN